MGKSPGKWFKSIILRKKSSKSNSLKDKNDLETPKNLDVLASSKGQGTRSTAGPGLVLVPAHQLRGSGVDSVHGSGTEQPDNAITLLNAKRDDEVNFLGLAEESEIIKHEKAAIKAQAAVRGYLARRSFQTLKCIIRVQAHIRGHLVRRQAVATLYCLRAIVKFQALARGKKVRCSNIGIKVQNACNLGKIKIVNSLVSSGALTSIMAEKVAKNVVARQLLVSMGRPLPLILQYDSENHNSAWKWLDRWSRSYFWASYSKIELNLQMKSEIKCKDFQGVEMQLEEKKSVRKQVRALENKSSGSNSNKSIRSQRKVSSSPVEKMHNHSEFDKVKRILRNPQHWTKEDGEKAEAVEKLDLGKGKSRDRSRRMSHSSVSEVLLQSDDVKIAEQHDNASLHLPIVAEDVGALHERINLNLQVENNGKSDVIEGTSRHARSKDHCIGNGDLPSSLRRSSFPPNIENQENSVQSMMKMPSYMAPTESAKAKLRAQGSSTFPQDTVEKNVTTRRLSLPSSTGGKVVSPVSPMYSRRLVHAAMGGIKIDRSSSSSRDDKQIRPEWRR